MAYSRGAGKNYAIVNCRNNYKKLSQWKKSIVTFILVVKKIVHVCCRSGYILSLRTAIKDSSRRKRFSSIMYKVEPA